MDETQLFLIPIFSLITLIFVFKFLIHKKVRNLAPSPLALPIIGHLHLIKDPVHKTLQKLSSKYGPIMSLRFGARRVLIISSPSAAEECFTTNDVVLANRPRLPSRDFIDYNATTLTAAPYGGLWRDLRRITRTEVFSPNQLKAYMGLREDEVKSLIKGLLFQDTWQGFTKVEMKSRIQGLSFNIIMRIVADKKVYGTEVEDLEEASKFREVITNVFEVIGASNPEDFIPLLQWIDFRGLEKKVMKLQDETNRFTQNLITERRSKRDINSSLDEGNANTFIDTMLSLQKSDPEYYNDDVIKGNILTLLLAGTDTTAGTIEWAMSLLLNHPDVLKKARTEIDEYIQHTCLLQETDLSKLPYIQFIVNETLRLFPAGPLLLPHEPSEDCTIGGFDVARGTIVLVNAWAIHRDPKVWDDSLSFKPERFEKVGNMGFGYMPFGMGRRQCPGVALTNRVVGLALASLIQCFEWERVGEELVELSEGKGLAMPKLYPLEAMCKARQSMIPVLKKL